MKASLKRLNREEFSHISSRAVEAQRELESIQARVYSGELDDMLLRRLKLEDDDANTSYLHSRCKLQASRNRVKTIKDRNGNLLTDYEDVKAEAVGFYKELFAASDDSQVRYDEELGNIIHKKIDAEDVVTLQASVSAAEIENISLCQGKKGSLGVKCLQDWNRICMAQHLWDICSNKESLWIKWVDEYRLKGKSFWSINPKSMDCWVWRLLLRHKEEIRHLVSKTIGDGRDTNFWHDNWHVQGVLSGSFSEEIKRRFRVPEDATMAEAITAGRWPTRRHCTQEIEDVIAYLPRLREGVRDMSTWNGSGSAAKASGIWRSLRHQNQGPTWAKLIWFRGHIPRHCFVAWTLCQERLPTKDKLISWGMDVDRKCLFCGDEESMNHLFSYLELQYVIVNYKGKSFVSRLRKLGWCCAIYEVWREMNNRIFGNEQRDVSHIVKGCITTIRSRVSSWRVPRNKENWKICVEWGLSLDILV
ncbi:reverse transcriptase [Lithospermum erythrorhizon]|uniref:Reverse transcriptase n=1 Tax=Lithospermum erythrorhizon TaxID=34254 RepID=A0AAV3P6W2_LITER